MLQSNVQTIQDSVPSELVKQTLRTLVANFLSTLAGTPVHKVEAALGPGRKTLPELMWMDFLWSSDGSYFPAYCSLYLLGEPAWSEHERHIHSFLEFAKDLYAERGGGPYKLRDICVALGDGRTAPIQPTSLIVGAHFSRSFGNYYHSFQGSPVVDLTHVQSGTAIEIPEIRFHLTPNILDYRHLDASWEEQIKSRLVRAQPSSPAGPAALRKESENVSEQSHDVFISHASEDKGYCGPLVEALEKAGILVWFDKTALKWGDDLRSTIDRGLSNCRYGIVIFSKAFLKRKKWTEYELSSLFALEKVGEKRILPIWHGVTHDDLLEYSAGLADRLAKVSSSDSFEDIVDSLREMLGRAAPDALREVNGTAKVETSEGHERIRSNAKHTITVAHANYRAEILGSPLYTSDDLSVKEIELLWCASKEPGDILHNITLDGESIRVNGRQFLAGVDARTGAEWVAAFRKLEKRGYVEPLSYDSDFFRVTGDGYQAADALEGFARWDARYVVLRAPYIGYKLSDEFRLSCTGVIALPAYYFDDQIAADGTIQRSVKEPPSLIVEGIDSKPALTWTPTEIEFFDNASKMLKIFGFEGMQFLRPGSLRLLAAHPVEGATPLGDDALDELANHGLLPGTEALRLVAEPDSDSKPDGFLVGSRNAWARFLEQCWPIIGPQILSIAQKSAATIEDVRRAFLPAKEHPHDAGLGTHFYRDRIQQATPADFVDSGTRFDQVSAEILQLTADKDRVARSCAEAQVALGLATNPKEKEHVEQVVQQRKENLTQLDAKLAELQRRQKDLEETLRDQQAYVCRSEMLDFLLAAEQPVDPRHIANAVAALPRKTWRESVALCSPIPFDSYLQHEYQVFLVMSAILKDQASDFSDGPVEAFRRALLKLPLGSPGQPFFWENWGDLKSVIEELGNSSALDPFHLTRMFLKKATRQKDPLEKILAESERLRVQ
jgi:hypothetical protein